MKGFTLRPVRVIIRKKKLLEETTLKYRVWLSILLSISLLTGCSTPFMWGDNISAKEGGDTLGLTPDFSYDVIEQTPNILINQIGYLNEENKTAILQGNDLENVFYVYNAYTNTKEYEGTLKSDNLGKNKDAETEEAGEEEITKDIYLADFSDVKVPGTYYLYHPDLGYSYEFKIGSKIYDEMEKNILSVLEEENKDTSLICYQLTGLLITKELYPQNVLEPEKLDEVCRKKMEKLMQAQDEKTGNVYANTSSAKLIQNLDDTQKQQYISLAATAEFAGTLAIYAYQLRDTDWNLAYQYQVAAEKAYRGIQNSLDNVGYDAGYFAAAHLYRLTGRAKYAQAIGQYLSMKEEQKSYTEYDFSLFGDYAYLTLRHGTNLEWSELIMKRIMEQAEEISLTARKNNYYVSDKREYNDINGKLRDMSNLALVNYIITNHEYSMLQKNYRDYFLGRNPYNICFADGFGTRNAVDEDININASNSGLFYLLLQSTKL